VDLDFERIEKEVEVVEKKDVVGLVNI